MVELVRGRLALGRLRQPEELQRGVPRPLHEHGIHPVIPDVEEADLGRGPGERGPDSGRIRSVAQGGNVDHGNFASVNWFNLSSGRHGWISGRSVQFSSVERRHR